VFEQKSLTLACPVCEGEHRYQLTVQRSIVIGMATAPGSLPETLRTFTQLFTCPRHSQRFEADVWLPETALSQIEALEVTGVDD
jgi:hypothetical protein